MTKIVDALNRAARQVSVTPPSSWASASTDTHLEVLDFLEDTADDVLERVDPPSPISAQYTLPTDGSETYALPSTCKRLQRDEFAVFETTTQRRPLTPVTNDGEWQHLKEIGTTGAFRYYRLTGYEGNWSISVFDLPSSGTEIFVNYVSTKWMADSSGTTGSAFGDNDDVLLMPRRLVEAGIVWRWRERKGLPYVDKYNEYEALLSRFSNDRRVRREVNFSGPQTYRRPWDVPVPDFIPSS